MKIRFRICGRMKRRGFLLVLHPKRWMLGIRILRMSFGTSNREKTRLTVGYPESFEVEVKSGLGGVFEYEVR